MSIEDDVCILNGKRTVNVAGHNFIFQELVHVDGVLCHHSPRWISLTFRQHPSYSVGDPYICATALYGPCYHFHLRHSLHLPFASGQHLLIPEPSHPSYVIGSFVTGTPSPSGQQEARPDSVVPPLLR